MSRLPPILASGAGIEWILLGGISGFGALVCFAMAFEEHGRGPKRDIRYFRRWFWAAIAFILLALFSIFYLLPRELSA
jgi:hypothetical protein